MTLRLHERRLSLCATLLLLLSNSVLTADEPLATRTIRSSGNPILGDGSYFSADAAPLSAEGKLYIYAGHDEPPPEVGGFVMHDYGVFATQDPASGDWELYQDNLDPKQVFDWATGNNAYAGHATRGQDGKYYWYVPVESKTTGVPNRMAIGVAVSDSPVGPWKDPLGRPLVAWKDVFGDQKVGQEIIDPHVFTDDDGTVYLYWGSWGVARVVELGDSMTALKGEVSVMSGLEAFFEAPWVFKRDGTYYLAYDWKLGGTEWTPSNYQAAIAYATSTSPTGPWKYQGIVLSGTSATTVHPSIVEHGGRWWMTYHTRDARAGGHFRRSIAIDEVHWQGDRILPVTQTWSDPPRLRLTNNLATAAKVSASHTEQPPMTLRALNDGRPPVVRLPPDQWGNYRGNKSTHESDWVQYEWPTSVRIAGVGIQFHQDPNWIRPPANWKLEYRDSNGQWRDIQDADYPAQPDQWLTIDFEPVTASALRATFNGQPEGPYFHSVSVSEWEVYSQPAVKLPTIQIKTTVGKAPELPATVLLRFKQGGAIPTPVFWRSVPPEQYAKPGTFTVEGKAAGQAAGYVIAKVKCKAESKISGSVRQSWAPYNWPSYNPKLEYDFRDQQARLRPPSKVLEDGVQNVADTVVSDWWCFRYGPNINPKVTADAWQPMLDRLNEDSAFLRHEFGWPPDKRAKHGYYSTVYLFGSGLSTDPADNEALGGWMGSVRHNGEDWPMVLLSYYPVWSFDPDYPNKDAGYQRGAVIHEYIHAIQADMPGCKKAAWFHEGGDNWLLGMMAIKRGGSRDTMGWLSAGSMIAPFMPIECYSGWLQDGSFGGPSAEGVHQGQDPRGRNYATWRNLLGGVAYSEAFPYFLGEFISEKSIAWIWQNCDQRVLEGIATKPGGLGDEQTRRLISEYRGRAAMCDFGKSSKAYENLLTGVWGVQIAAEGDPIWKRCEPWKATCYAKTTIEDGLIVPDPLTLPGWTGANQIPLEVSAEPGDTLGLYFYPKGTNMSCQLVYRATDGSVVYSRPVHEGPCGLRLDKPVKNNVVIAVVCNTDYAYEGEATRTRKWDYRLKLGRGIEGAADIYEQWFKAD